MKEIDFRRDLLPLKDKIYRMALRITLNAPEAEDLTQDTLVRLWSRRHELDAVASLEAFAITTVRNLALDHKARKDNLTLSIEVEEADTPDAARTPEEQLIHDDRLRQVHEIFNALPLTQRTALQLRDIEGMSYQEAALAMQVTESNFKVILHRARQAVKAQYEKSDYHHEL